MSERLTVFDIEVLNKDASSICAIGIVELLDQEVVSTYYSLIKPRNLSFDKRRYLVHQIKPESLQNERSFFDVWQDIHHYFENRIVISHHIQGDIAALQEALKQSNIPFPTLRMSCTHVLAQLVYPDLPKYNLKDLSDRMGLEYQTHHALEDAKACATLLLDLLHQQQCQTVEDLHGHFHLDFGIMKDHYYSHLISAEMASLFYEMQEHSDAFLYHQSICFTGMLSLSRDVLTQKAKQVSAVVTQQVSMNTHYLVIGKKAYYQVRFRKKNKKVKKALELIKQGQDLKIIHENQYLELLKIKKDI